MLSVTTTDQFESDLSRMIRSGSDPELLWALVDLLVESRTVPEEFRDHELEGEWAGVRDIHIEADWLLLYRISKQSLHLVRTGTHNDLF